MKKIYISGKITGLPVGEVKARFQQAELMLIGLGYEVVNPLKNGLTKEHSWAEHMLRDIESLFDCDVIYMLNNWMDSKGARIEKNIADELGMDVWFESNVEQTENITKRIQNTIHEVTGLKFEEYTTKSRKRDTFFARMIFAYHCRNHRMTLMGIAKYINRDHAAIVHYLRRYDDEVKYNPNFRNLAEKVDEILYTKA